MADVVNLREARKVRDRAAAATQADRNRAKFGRTKAQKQSDAAETARREQALDGARLEQPAQD